MIIGTDQLQTSRDIKIVVVGSYAVGLTFGVPRVPDAGETIVGLSFSAGHGGKGSNQAVAAARLGARVILHSAVGSDVYGRQAATLWKAEGVDAAGVVELEGSTMVGVILVEENGENRIVIIPGALGRFAPDLLDGLDSSLVDADVLLVGLEIPIVTAHAALLAGRRAGVTTILNPAPAPSDPLPPEMLRLVDHITPNRSEAARSAGMTITTAPERLIAARCFDEIGTVAMTLGSDGVLLRHDGVLTRLEAVMVTDAVDTTGAGDAFNGAYAVRLARGDSPTDAARFATRAAAHSVRIDEVIPSLPYLSDLAQESTQAIVTESTS